MRKFIFYTLTAVLAAILLARAMLPPPAQYAMAPVDGTEYNVLDVALPVTAQTAGSALIAEMNSYYLQRTPTKKNAYSGILKGKNLILICAENWTPNLSVRSDAPTLRQLRQEGAKFTQVYRPDWYQGTDGSEFALLSGLMPTRVNNTTALLYAGAQDIYLPFATARCFADAGYATCSFISDPEHEAAYAALGFETVELSADGAQSEAADTVTRCAEGSKKPFFAFFLWDASEADGSLAAIMDELPDNTAVCVLTGSREADRAQLFLWSRDFPAPETDIPCSELDLAPTLENLFGLSFDSRFLSGRDIFAEPSDTPDAATPLVTLRGSAFSDWITEAGRYIAAEERFVPAQAEANADTAYIEAVCKLQYDRYIFARRILENNYFALLFDND